MSWWEQDQPSTGGQPGVPGAGAPPSGPISSVPAAAPLPPAPAANPAAPVAGWYPDPQGSGTLRYWNGTGWAAESPAAPGTALAPAPFPTPAHAAAMHATPMHATHFNASATFAHSGVAVSPKNPAVALLVSFFIPGVGTMMNGETGKGVGILLGYLFSCVLILIGIGLLTTPAFWIWGMVDAYNGAVRWNAEHGIVS